MTPPNSESPVDNSFIKKWSVQILEHGFTAVPNLLISCRDYLGISPSQLLVLIAIESYRWDTDDPWPSLTTLSVRTGYTTRSLSRTITHLENKGLIRRIRRRGTSNKYSMQPLIDELTIIAQKVSTKGQKIHTASDNSNQEIMTILSSKEYAANKTQLIKTTKKMSDINFGEILQSNVNQNDSDI